MATVRSAWGIDLGNRALKAVKLIREGDQFRIADFEVIEHEQILSMAGDNKESLLQTALAQFVERHQLKGAVVAVGVSGQQSFARFIKLPPVEPKKIPEIVRFEAIQQIPFPLDDVEWSYQLFQQPESPDVEVGIFAMKKDLVNRQIGYFTSLGLNVQVVQTLPLAVYNAMNYDGHTAQTTIFMDCGAENTDLIVAEGDTVWLRTLQIGGNTFTEVLAKAFKLDFVKAEELKRNAATSKYAKQIFQAMRPVFADLVAEIQRSMGFYTTAHRDARIGRIVALGSTFQLPGLQKYLAQNLSLPVEKIDTFKSLPPTEAKTATALQEAMISLSGAYGLALQAMGGGKITSSLLPETIRRQKMWKEKTKWFATAAAAALLATCGIAGRLYYEKISYDANQLTRDSVKKTIGQAQRLSANWRTEVEGQGGPDQNKLIGMQVLLDYRNLWPTLISDIVLSIPGELPDRLKTVPRGDRKQIVLDAAFARYFGSLKDPLTPNIDMERFMTAKEQIDLEPVDERRGVFGGPGRGDRTDDAESSTKLVADPNAQSGFVITLRGTTPNKGKETFIDKELVTKMLAKTVEAQATAGKPYYIAKAELVRAGPRKKPTDQENRGIDEGDAVGFLQAGRDKRKEAALDLSKDRTPGFTDESILNDTEFTVVLVVALDPAKVVKAAEAKKGQ
jgi:type IV pilus assembly protein PilM